jgi:hypothetical protein
MGVRKKDGALAHVFAEKLRAERANPGARVEDDDLVAHADLDAGRVAPVAAVTLGRDGDASSYSPEGDTHSAR